MSGSDLTPTKISEDRAIVSQMSPADIVKQVIEVVRAIGKYGLTTLIFAFPVLLGCYGLYFLWLAVSTTQLNVGMMIIGMFATIFGPCLTIVLLLIFTKLQLWDKLRCEEKVKPHAGAFGERSQSTVIPTPSKMLSSFGEDSSRKTVAWSRKK